MVQKGVKTVTNYNKKVYDYGTRWVKKGLKKVRSWVKSIWGWFKKTKWVPKIVKEKFVKGWHYATKKAPNMVKETFVKGWHYATKEVPKYVIKKVQVGWKEIDEAVNETVLTTPTPEPDPPPTPEEPTTAGFRSFVSPYWFWFYNQFIHTRLRVSTSVMRIQNKGTESMKPKKLFILVIFLILIIACSFGVYRVYWCVLQGKCPQNISREVDNIKLTIWSPKRFYEEDEIVIILVSIKNKRREEARLYPSENQAALEVTYNTNKGEVIWHEEHPEIANNTIILNPGEVYEIEIRIPPEDQFEYESGRLCVKIQVNYPGGWNGGYGINTCLSYNNRPY